MTPCVGEPISWLRLERYGLDELSGVERAQVSEHLRECPACRAVWARIEADVDRQLPPLAAPVSGPRSGIRMRPRVRARPAWVAAAAGMLAAAAAAALVVWTSGPGLDPPRSRIEIKGGELSLELVRLGGDGQLADATHYHPDDRFKVLLTCPPAFGGIVELVVYQDGRAYFPLDPQPVASCGNRKPLDGAFRVDGDTPVRICVAFSERALDRERLARGVDGLPEQAVCEALEREPAR